MTLGALVPTKAGALVGEHLGAVHLGERGRCGQDGDSEGGGGSEADHGLSCGLGRP